MLVLPPATACAVPVSNDLSLPCAAVLFAFATAYRATPDSRLGANEGPSYVNDAEAPLMRRPAAESPGGGGNCCAGFFSRCLGLLGCGGAAANAPAAAAPAPAPNV